MSETPTPTIETCIACGKLIPSKLPPLCSACVRIEDNRFRVVRDFLRANNGGAVADIARETGISAADVSAFLERGRLIEVRAGVDARPPAAADSSER